MITPDANIHSISTPVQVQQAAIPPPAEMPFLSAPVHNHTAFHYTRFTRHTLLRPIARETGSRIYLQEQPTCGFWYLNHGVIGLHHTLKTAKSYWFAPASKVNGLVIWGCLVRSSITAMPAFCRPHRCATLFHIPTASSCIITRSLLISC